MVRPYAVKGRKHKKRKIEKVVEEQKDEVLEAEEEEGVKEEEAGSGGLSGGKGSGRTGPFQRTISPSEKRVRMACVKSRLDATPAGTSFDLEGDLVEGLAVESGGGR